MKEPRVYKSSPIVIIVLIVFFVFVFGGILFAVGSQEVVFILPFLAFIMLLLVYAFVAQFATVTVSEEEISVKKLFGTKTLSWSEIARVSGWGYAFKLHNRDEDVKLSISPRLPGYEEIIEFTGTKRPDLFSPNEYSEMKRGLAVYILMFFFMVLILGISAAFVYSTFDPSTSSLVEYLPMLVFVILALFFGALTFSVPRSLTINGNILDLKYIFGEKSVRADEIALIQLRFTQSRNGKQYFINLSLRDRKDIQLRGLGVGLPIAYLVLKNWHKSHTQGQQPVSANVAPNWSDNSGR